MSGGVPVTHLDDADEYLCTGTHKGANGASVLSNPGADFASCGVSVTVGQLVQNTTDGSEGVVTAVTEDTVTCTLTGGTDNDWDNGDTYVILKTATEDSIISTIFTDKRFGRKATDQAQLQDGLFPEDRDLDEDGEEIFGPGQPAKR